MKKLATSAFLLGLIGWIGARLFARRPRRDAAERR
jgi:hypothetical protein